MTRNAALATFDRFDRGLVGLAARYGPVALRVSLGVVFLWFGALKFFPGMSPAEELVRSTVTFVDPEWFIPMLAIWEVVIGLGLISGRFMRLTLLLLFAQMPGTVMPLFVLPEACWTDFPFALTLEGQYIIKNMVLVAAAVVLGSMVRGGKISVE